MFYTAHNLWGDIKFDLFDAATEIRCEEKSKGGLKYDVILADPAGTPPAPKRLQSPTRTKSIENIEEKMKAAEERRLVSFRHQHLLTWINNYYTH